MGTCLICHVILSISISPKGTLPGATCECFVTRDFWGPRGGGGRARDVEEPGQEYGRQLGGGQIRTTTLVGCLAHATKVLNCKGRAFEGSKDCVGALSHCAQLLARSRERIGSFAARPSECRRVNYRPDGQLSGIRRRDSICTSVSNHPQD